MLWVVPPHCSGLFGSWSRDSWLRPLQNVQACRCSCSWFPQMCCGTKLPTDMTSHFYRIPAPITKAECRAPSITPGAKLISSACLKSLESIWLGSGDEIRLYSQSLRAWHICSIRIGKQHRWHACMSDNHVSVVIIWGISDTQDTLYNGKWQKTLWRHHLRNLVFSEV